MTTLRDYVKDPGATLDYGILWADWLQPGEVIVTSEWTVEPAEGLTVLSKQFLGGAAVIWIEDGTPGAYYRLTNTITTNKVDPVSGKPRTNVRSLGVTVREQ